ncbi:MAG: hypothetical protein U0Z17_07470 [Bacteroidales bacterium]
MDVFGDCGNKAEQVSVTYAWTMDAVKPIISTTAVSEFKGCNPTVVAPVFTLTEAYSPGTINVVDGGVLGTGCAKSPVWTCTFTDACNNGNDEKVITYTWTEDTHAPSFTGCPAEKVTWTSSIPPVCADALALVRVTDGCTSNIIPTCEAGQIDITGCERSQTFTLTAKDGCGNSASCAITHTWIVDDEKPIFNGYVYLLRTNCIGFVINTSGLF